MDSTLILRELERNNEKRKEKKINKNKRKFNNRIKKYIDQIFKKLKQIILNKKIKIT